MEKDRVSQRTKQQDSESIRNREMPLSVQRVRDEDCQRDREKQSPRKRDKETGEEPSPADTHVETEAEGPGAQEEQGKWRGSRQGLQHLCRVLWQLCVRLVHVCAGMCLCTHLSANDS